MNRGEVVDVDWPYSDLSGTKVRPAVVVQANFLNALLDDTIFVKITGRRYGIPGTEVELDPTAETAADSGRVAALFGEDRPGGIDEPLSGVVRFMERFHCHGTSVSNGCLTQVYQTVV